MEPPERVHELVHGGRGQGIGADLEPVEVDEVPNLDSAGAKHPLGGRRRLAVAVTVVLLGAGVAVFFWRAATDNEGVATRERTVGRFAAELRVIREFDQSHVVDFLESDYGPLLPLSTATTPGGRKVLLLGSPQRSLTFMPLSMTIRHGEMRIVFPSRNGPAFLALLFDTGSAVAGTGNYAEDRGGTAPMKMLQGRDQGGHCFSVGVTSGSVEHLDLVSAGIRTRVPLAPSSAHGCGWT